MDEAEDLCDRIAIIDHGKILTVGTLDELTRLAGEAEVLRLNGSFEDDDARRRLEAIVGVRVLKADDGVAVLSVDAGGPGLLAVLPKILEADLDVNDVSIQQPNLQSVFISLTGKELRD
jgi:ABC-2 type transport system ATP-binding protein